MFLLFKTVSEQQLGLVRRVGQYLDYVVGWLDDSVKDIVPLSHLNPTVIDNEDVAMAWKFAANYSGYLSVRAGTLANDQLDIISSTEPDGAKVKYYLTDKDREHGATFMKLVLRKMLDEVYDRRMAQLNLSVSDLEISTWSRQIAEAQAYTQDPSTDVTMIGALANARGISISEMAARIIAANTSYNQSITELLAKKQLIETEIKACHTIIDLNVLIHRRFGYNMPVNQQKDLNWVESSKYDL